MADPPGASPAANRATTGPLRPFSIGSRRCELSHPTHLAGPPTRHADLTLGARYCAAMRLIGLTGGIGSGKSTVSAGLSQRGAQLIDADQIVRDLQQPGAPVFEAMVERWGPGIVAADGSLDRPAVAAIVFADDAELKALEKLIHPEVRIAMRAQMDAAASSDDVVILDIPLLAEGRRDGGTAPDARGASAIIVVDCPIDIAVHRLVTYRGFDEDDARARIAKQVSREERVALADFVVDNSGSPEELEVEIARCWSWLDTLEPTPWPPPEEAPANQRPPDQQPPDQQGET